MQSPGTTMISWILIGIIGEKQNILSNFMDKEQIDYSGSKGKVEWIKLKMQLW